MIVRFYNIETPAVTITERPVGVAALQRAIVNVEKLGRTVQFFMVNKSSFKSFGDKVHDLVVDLMIWEIPIIVNKHVPDDELLVIVSPP